MLSLGAARSTMSAGVRLLDRSAAEVARSTASAVPSAPGPTAAAPRPAPAAQDRAPDLVGAMTGLLVADDVVAAGAFVARRAEDAYRSAMGLLD